MSKGQGYCRHCGLNFDDSVQNHSLPMPIYLCRKSPNKRHDFINILERYLRAIVIDKLSPLFTHSYGMDSE